MKYSTRDMLLSKKEMDVSMNKIIVAILIILVVSTVAGIAFASSGGDYEISWWTIDGGGGTSSGGGYEISGTIGQPEAGVMAGGSYVLSGGFWPGSKWCFVGMPDMFNFLQDWLKTGAGWAGDLNDDNSVDLVDYNIIATHWLRLCPDSWPWW